MSDLMNNESEYLRLFDQITEDIAETRLRVTMGANSEVVRMYWRIGREIDVRATWGSKFIDTLSRDIRMAFPGTKGFSVRNLKYMAKFARETSEELCNSCCTIPWGTITHLMDKTEPGERREWYMSKCLENGWSRAVLMHQIELRLYERQALPSKVNNFAKSLPSPQSDMAREQQKDPYVFDFITARQDATEHEIEQEMVKNVTKLLLELGTGFAFLGNQYHLEVDGLDFYLDLLFYNTRLRCYVVVEVKNAKFEPEHVGKLNFYLTAVDELLRGEYDNPSVGLLLCREKNDVVAEWSLRNVEKPIGVSEYHLSDVLPSIEDIRRRVLRKVGGGADE